MDPVKLWEYHLQDCLGDRLRQIDLWATEHGDPSEAMWRVTVLGSPQDGRDILAILDLKLGENPRTRWLALPKRNGRLSTSSEAIYWQACDGGLYHSKFSPRIFRVRELNLQPVDIENAQTVAEATARFPEFCLSSHHVMIHPIHSEASLCTHIGLGKSGKLHIVNDQVAHVLATNATSFVVTDRFCVFTTATHEAVFAPLSSLASLAMNGAEGEAKNVISGWEKRRIERGSRIITAVPSTMSLVLQMPRGNLETINPRPLVMEVIKQDLDAWVSSSLLRVKFQANTCRSHRGNYRKALLACRKHRIDLNILVEHNRSAFLNGLSTFVEQVDDVDHFNLFLTSLGYVCHKALNIWSILNCWAGVPHNLLKTSLSSVTRCELNWKQKI